MPQRSFVIWWRGLPSAAVDVAIAGLAAVGTVGPALAYPGRSWWNVLLALAASVPLVWRRQATIPTTAVVGIATIALASSDPPPPVFLPYGALICTYTFALLAAPVWQLAAAIGTVVGVAASLAIPGEDATLYAYVGMAHAAAYALGTAARAQRAQAVVLSERTRRLDEAHAAAVAKERTHISRDLHDILTHSVGLMVVQAEAGAAVIRGDSGQAEAAFDAISRTGRDAIDQLRRLLGALRSAETANRAPQPRIGALTGLVEQVRQAGIDVSIACDGQPRALPVDVDIAAYRIVQESLTNTLRHAAARRAQVRLRWSRTALHIEVTDDGQGPGSASDGGYGIVGMRERAAACGGTLTTGPTAGGRGFSVSATLPVA